MPTKDENSHSTQMEYRPDIDGLRAVAVLAVVGFHGFYSDFKGGFIGVDIFFVISGFLISTIIFKSLDQGSFSFSEFYRRRIRRIFPALVLVLLAVYGFGWRVLLTDEYQQLGKHIAGGAGFVANFVLWNESGYFDNAANSKPLLHLWSLGIEEQFYIFWPFLLWLAWKKNLDILKSTLMLAGLSFAFNIYLHRSDPVADFYSPLTRIWELFAGSALAHIMLYRPASIPDMQQRLASSANNYFFNGKDRWDTATIDHLQSILGAILITIGLLVIRKDKFFPGYWALLPVAGALLIIASSARSFVNRKLLCQKIMVGIGLISYPLYLWHWPLFSYVHIVEPAENFKAYRVPATLASFLLAWATYRLIEKPIRFGKFKNKAAGLLVFAMICAGATGYATYLKGGIESRAIARMSQKITAAKSDWGGMATSLVDGKIEHFKIFKGQVDDQVLFIGDSIMGQYFPRLHVLYSETPLPWYSSYFAARNHCQPIPDYDLLSTPENINCIDYYKAAMELARNPVFKKVVLAGNWIDLAPDNKLGEQATQMIEDLKQLVNSGKEVILILTHPRGGEFAPDNIIKPIRKRRLEKLKDYSVDRKTLEVHDASKNRAIKQIARKSGAVAINPYDYFCPEGQCPVLIDGHALYLDGDHIRAKHAREHAVFMDEIVNTRRDKSIN